ncbi:MAG: ATP-binding protein [Oscillospiraceae bacterium]|mgnify:FL=1|nr:ATP-binding protein [Oscillospiraceae bacterium]
MEIMRAKLMSISVYKNILETEPMKALLRLTEAKTADALIRSYTDLVYSVWSEGFSTLPDYISWHLKYDESFIGNAIAAGTAPQFMEDAAAMDIRRLSSVAMLSCSGLKRNIANACSRLGEEYTSIIQNLAELPMGRGFQEEEIFESYRKKGCGQFALGRAFHWEKGQLTQVKHSDPIDQRDMIGYEFQRNAVVENTRVMLSGKPTNNVLLYGDSGTGKSATVKSLVNIPEFYNLRLIEIAKNSLDELTELIRQISRHTQKFIIYIDDLSFEQEDKGFSALKTALEGGLERRPDNVAIYVTSNRRHMIRESFSDRQGDDVHVRETMEERTSLSERFGLRLSYLALDKKKYQDMVLSMCHRMGLDLPDNQILVEANRWEIQHGGRTPRVAVQLVEKLAGQQEKAN